MGQTGLSFPYQNSRFVSINHPPEAKPSHWTPEKLLWLHEIHQSFQHWPFLKLEAFMKCIGKHPKAPTFNIDVDTNKKVEKMKKDGKVLRFGFLWKGYVKCLKELQQCIPIRTPRFQPKNSCLTFGASFQRIASMVGTMLQVFDIYRDQ